ncbi:hypothetical protein [Streptomyces sp. NPDC048272]|uniref:hypothetical protein n=1 Tax=Streptomyces sp. NPDC048272 TaxID=3154616 RepID=UPI00341B1EF4
MMSTSAVTRAITRRLVEALPHAEAHPADITLLAVVPPPSSPLLFADGDRYEWPPAGNVWIRAAADWKPTPDDGSGKLTDAEVRASLRRAVVTQQVSTRFIPALPSDALTRTPLHSLAEARHLDFGTARSAAQYVRADGGDLATVGNMVSEADEDFVYGLRRPATLGDVSRLLGMMLVEQVQLKVTYHMAAGRLYARCERYDPAWREVGRPPEVKCLHVFVLSAAPAEA